MRTEEPEPDILNAQAEHAWQTFLAIMPKVNGKHLDVEACKEYWARSPAKWPQWISSVKHYAGSERVQRGIGICNPMTFLARRYLDWLQPEQPLGEDEMAKRTALEELTQKLKDRRNTAMPTSSMSAESKKIFYEIGLPWKELQERVASGDSLSDLRNKKPPPAAVDVKMAAAGEQR